MKPHRLIKAIIEIRSRKNGPEVAELLAELENPERPEYPSLPKGKLFIQLDDVLKFTSEVTGIPIDVIIGKQRKPVTVLARRVYAFVASEYCPVTREDAGLPINRDHSMISYYINGGGKQNPSAQHLYANDPVFKSMCDQVFDLAFKELNK